MNQILSDVILIEYHKRKIKSSSTKALYCLHDKLKIIYKKWKFFPNRNWYECFYWLPFFIIL